MASRFILVLVAAAGVFGCSACEDDQLRALAECEIAANHERPELCNGKDDDCDGIVDEGCDDDADGYCDASMSVEEGAACALGGGDCDDQDPSTNPGADETCNGKDDDCDARIDTDDPGIEDDRLAKPCNDSGAPEKAGTGVCRDGSTVCRYGAVICENAVGPSAEACNGRDDDCNGLTDDGTAAYEVCASPSNPLVGTCTPGFFICRNGGMDRSRCVNETLPVAETCDGLDNDCDGTPDDGVGTEDPVYVTFHLDCSGSMIDKIDEIRAFLDDLDTLPSFYLSSNVLFALVLYPDGNGQRPWVHRTHVDVASFRASLSSVNTNGCGWLEPNVDAVTFAMCASRPTLEWPSGHLCRTLYDAEWNRCGGAGGNASLHPAGTICRSVLTGGYQNSRLFELPAPDAAHQLHVLMTDEDLQSNHALTATSAANVQADLQGTYAANGWQADVKTVCFLAQSYASQFGPMCDSTYPLSSGTTSASMMANFTNELRITYCR